MRTGFKFLIDMSPRNVLAMLKLGIWLSTLPFGLGVGVFQLSILISVLKLVFRGYWSAQDLLGVFVPPLPPCPAIAFLMRIWVNPGSFEAFTWLDLSFGGDQFCFPMLCF